MNKSKIEWCDYTTNPIKGLCKIGCSYCYARRMYKRFKWNPEIRLDENELLAPYRLKKPSKIFICSTHEIFGDWIPIEWIKKIIKVAEDNPQHIFQFLTKKPAKYRQFSFPKNCWLGITVTGEEGEFYGFLFDYFNKENLKFVSYEPLLKYIPFMIERLNDLNWLIVGGLTPKPIHEKYWIYLLINQANKLNIPVFLKDNLIGTVGKDYVMKYRELPQ